MKPVRKRKVTRKKQYDAYAKEKILNFYRYKHLDTCIYTSQQYLQQRHIITFNIMSLFQS